LVNSWFSVVQVARFRERLFNRLLSPKKQPAQTVDVLTGYAEWAKSYPAKAHNLLMQLEEQAMLSLLPDTKGKICLDLACGSGRYLAHLQAQNAGRVFGVDYSADMLAQAHAAVPSFSLARSPFLALPFPANSFDLITCGLAVGHEQNLNGLLAEAARLLRPAGIILYSDFHPFVALAGGQRTFTGQNGRVFTLTHYIHLYQHHQQACRAAGLSIETVLEPVPGAPAQPSFRQIPAVLVIRAAKPNDHKE
jgi:malonyl-CoA O-methyltransferase